MLPDVAATRYVTPLREGGSLPGLMEADDLGTYVVKFTGAGQGRTALVAEVIVGELARALSLPVPALVTVEVDPVLAANEPDEEVQDLLRASPGRNLGVDFLPGALDFVPGAFEVDPVFAGRVLWFDALVGNVDRSWRNPNLLLWHGRPYLIDHGAALTFHHTGRVRPRPHIVRTTPSEHVLLGCSSGPGGRRRGALDRARDGGCRGRAGAGRMAARRRRLRAARPRSGTRTATWFAARLAARDAWGRSLADAVAAGPVRRPAPSGPRPGWLSMTRHPFEYAVLRVVPRVERGESINAGVLVYCRALDYLGAAVHLDVARLLALDPSVDVAHVQSALRSIAEHRATTAGVGLG